MAGNYEFIDALNGTLTDPAYQAGAMPQNLRDAAVVYSEAETDALLATKYSKAETDALLAVKQPLDATLTALAGFSTNGILVMTAADTFVARAVTGTAGQITVTNGNGVSGNPTLSLPADMIIPTILTTPNTGLHILDTDASHDLIIRGGTNLTADRTFTLNTGDSDRVLDISTTNVTISSAAATVLDDASVGAMLTTLGGQPLDAQLTAVAGLTGVDGSFIRWTGTATAVMQAIIGTVAQSGGVSTGANFEIGSNANGRYLKLASGDMFCWFVDATGLPAATADGSLFKSASDGTWTYPVAFASAPVVTGAVQVSATNRWAVIGFPGSTTCTYNNYRATSSAGTVPFSLFAIGRWV